MNRGVAQHRHLAGFGVHFDIDQVRTEGIARRHGMRLAVGGKRAAGVVKTTCEILERDRLVAVTKRSVVVLDIRSVALPEYGRAFGHLLANDEAGVVDCHPGGHGNATTRGDRVEPDTLRVDDLRVHVFHRNAKSLGELLGETRARAADIGTPLDEVDRAVRVDMHRDARPTANVEPESEAKSPAAVGAFERAVPVWARLQSVEDFDTADAWVYKPIDALRALLGRVLEAKFKRIHAEFTGDVVHDRLGGETDVGRPRRTVSLSTRLVDDNIEPIDNGVRDVVTTENTHATTGYGRAGKRSGLEGHPGLASHERTVFLGAKLDPHHRGGRRPRGLEHIGAIHGDLDRAAALLAQNRSDRLEVDRDLAAETAADLRGCHGDGRNGQAQHFGRLQLRDERSLGRGPDLQIAVRVPVRGAGMRLDVALVDSRGLVLTLDDHVGILEALGRVTYFEVKVLGDVARLVRDLSHRVGIDVVVDERSVILHAIRHPRDGLKLLVLDLEKLDGLLCLVKRTGRDGRDSLALVEHLASCQTVGTQMGDVDHIFAEILDLFGRLGKVGARHHGEETGVFLGLRGVDGLDARVRVRTAQYPCVHRARDLDVISVFRPAGDLVDAVVAYGTGSDDLVLGSGSGSSATVHHEFSVQCR